MGSETTSPKRRSTLRSFKPASRKRHLHAGVYQLQLLSSLSGQRRRWSTELWRAPGAGKVFHGLGTNKVAKAAGTDTRIGLGQTNPQRMGLR